MVRNFVEARDHVPTSLWITTSQNHQSPASASATSSSSSVKSHSMATAGRAYAARSALAGQGLFAAQDIKPGELIFDLARPAVAALDTGSLPSVCANCFASAAGASVLHGEVNGNITVKACTGCKTLRYCSKVGSQLFINRAPSCLMRS